MNIKRTIFISSLIYCVISTQSYSQSAKESNISNLEHLQVSGTPNDFPELINTAIPGAPKLAKPQLIMGDTIPVRGEGMGWAAPAAYDWDGDGKKNLLIGEFLSGLEDKGISVGNFIRIYKNKGTNEVPEFYDDFQYAKEISNLKESTGTPLSIYTWCCLAFTPRFVDLDNDGFTDLLTGQYLPGYITWFRGSERGFLSGIKLEEAYDPIRDRDAGIDALTLPITDPKSNAYWYYSSAAFGDFDNDGDQDMIIGGKALRFCKNIGNKSNPKFGTREVLFDVKGQKLESVSKSFTVPYVVDWDKDGVLDILMTDSFSQKGSIAVTYFRGVKSEGELRFKEGVPLFKAKNGGKTFPGSWLNIYVTDWNNDGVNDLLIGTSVATLNGVFNHELSWDWEKDTGISKKNPAFFSKGQNELIELSAKKADSFARIKSGLSDEEWEKTGYIPDGIKHYYGKAGVKNKTLAHQGYVYVMLGGRSVKKMSSGHF